MRRSDLEKRLAVVSQFSAPRPELEQYRTPDKVAAEFVWTAWEEQAIEGAFVVDLGCGTGVLGLAAALLGAKRVLGIDLDQGALQEATAAAQSVGMGKKMSFQCMDVDGWQAADCVVDTVIMNPPFGAQRSNRHADRTFLDAAIAGVRPDGTIWFLAQERTEAFLSAYAKEKGFRIDKVGAWDYPLPAQFAFHEKDVVMVRVGGYRLARA